MSVYYRVPVHFTFFFLLVSVIVGCIRLWLSIKQKSDLLNEAITSVIVLLSFHMCVYHGNIYLWRLKKIDYFKPFNFSAQENLYDHPYWRMLQYMICACVYLFFGLSKIGGDHLLFFVLVGITGYTIYAYRSDFLKIFSFRTRQVTKIDIFLTDQLCSQVPGFRRILYILCYFITFSFMKRDYGFHKTSEVHYWLSYVISSLPFVWRVFQCWWKYCKKPSDDSNRRETPHDKSHLINMGKYICAMLEAIVRVGYENDKTVVWLSLLVVISVIATVYQLYWDFARDWDIVQFKPQFPQFEWRERELKVTMISYVVAVGVNLVLRFGWAFQFILSRFKLNDQNITIIVALVEVFRRGMWNFFRLENEEVKREKREREKREREEGSIDNADQV